MSNLTITIPEELRDYHLDAATIEQFLRGVLLTQLSEFRRFVDDVEIKKDEHYDYEVKIYMQERFRGQNNFLTSIRYVYARNVLKNHLEYIHGMHPVGGFEGSEKYKGTYRDTFQLFFNVELK